MKSVLTNVGAMQALQALSITGRELQQTQNRIASGLKVAKPQDNAAAYSISRNIRSEMGGWRTVGEGLQSAEAMVSTARAGAEALQDNLLQIRARLMQLAGLSTQAERASIAAEVSDLLKLGDNLVNQSEFAGVNLLSSGAPPALTAAPPTANGAGALTFTRDGGSAPGRLELEVFCFAWPDVVEIWKDGARVAATGQPYVPGGAAVGPAAPASDRRVLMFDYVPTPSQTVEFRFNDGYAGSGWRIDRIDMVYDNPPPLQVLRSPAGDKVDLNFRPLSARALGLDPIIFDPIETGLAQVMQAIDDVAAAAVHFGGKQREIETAAKLGGVLKDKLEAGLGDLVDADLAEEQRKLAAVQTRQALAAKSLQIANSAPQLLLRLFSRNSGS